MTEGAASGEGGSGYTTRCMYILVIRILSCTVAQWHADKLQA
jgi:hypothetical protein